MNENIVNYELRNAERAVLGSMLRDNAVIPDVVAILRADYFSFDAHHRLFKAVVGLWDGGKPADLVTLAEDLRARGWLDDVGGVTYLGELWTASPTASNAEYYARIVRDKAIEDRLCQVGAQTEADARNHVAPPMEQVDAAERRILAIAQLGVEGQTVSLDTVVCQIYERIDRRVSNGPHELAVPTGLMDLDELTGGLQPSELTIIGARPSVGKTGLAGAIARNAIHRGDGVFFASLEQAAVELGERLICAEAGIDSHKMRLGTLTGDEVARVKAAGDRLRPMPLFIDERPGQSMLRITANARRLKQRHGVKLVILDYLQLVEPDNRREPRHEQVAGISRRLKHLARELAVPVIALAQLNRASEDRTGQEPRLSDLRESGGIEADADVVLLLHRPSGASRLDVIVAKNRNGPTGRVAVSFARDTQRFENYLAEPFGSTMAHHAEMN